MESLSRNLRLSLRQIRRQPAFAAAVVLTLGLAIGANTAIFSFVNALLIRPFPFRDPGQRCFGSARDIVGRTVTLDHAPGYQIHGVAARGFDFPRGIEVYRSIGGFALYDKRDSRNLVGIARIRRPHSISRFQAELDTI